VGHEARIGFQLKFPEHCADVFLMGASLTVAAVRSGAPARLGRDGVVLTPVRLPASFGLPLESGGSSVGCDLARGDAIVAGGTGISDVGLSGFTLGTLGAGNCVAAYLVWAGIGGKGRFVNFYA
jgi:hypothetical protein